MLGIQEIASYIPEGRESNFDKKEKFDITDRFIEEKIGVREIAVKGPEEDTSDLCIKAFNSLLNKMELVKDEIQVLLVVTQNPDYNLPHTSAIVHGKLGFSTKCACFDISLGCSGYVYGLSVIQSFMNANGFTKGLLFTSDPYSKIIDPNDKNTSLLFGDGASVSLISDNPVYTSRKFTFGTIGKNYQDLKCENNNLYMNGRAVFNFAAKQIPKDIVELVKLNDLSFSDIDRFIFHQGSRYIIETLKKRLELPCEKVAYDIFHYGNTVSSSIPIILESEMQNESNKLVLISGFGVGLSWSSSILQRNNT